MLDTILVDVVQTQPSWDGAQRKGEVNHAGSFLCRRCDCLLCPDVGFYQGVGSPLGRIRWNTPLQESSRCFCSFI